MIVINVKLVPLLIVKCIVRSETSNVIFDEILAKQLTKRFLVSHFQAIAVNLVVEDFMFLSSLSCNFKAVNMIETVLEELPLCSR